MTLLILKMKAIRSFFPWFQIIRGLLIVLEFNVSSRIAVMQIFSPPATDLITEWLQALMNNLQIQENSDGTIGAVEFT